MNPKMLLYYLFYASSKNTNSLLSLISPSALEQNLTPHNGSEKPSSGKPLAQIHTSVLYLSIFYSFVFNFGSSAIALKWTKNKAGGKALVQHRTQTPEDLHRTALQDRLNRKT